MAAEFGPELRLRQRREFLAVDDGGRRVSNRFVTLVGKPNGGAVDRLGIVASRRIGGAVERNRAKRRLRDMFRRRACRTGERCLDIVAIAKLGLVTAPFDLVQADFLAALLKLRGAR
jgi:ribonuclease P protein component